MKNKNGFFVSGTDTDVGKTIVSAVLVYKLKGVYWKPIQCGRNQNGLTDKQLVINLLKLKKNRFLDENYFFEDPISPNLASKKKNLKISLKNISHNKILKEPLIVEGAGGLMVPINEKDLIVDLIKFIGLPLILVARTSLGTINHTLLSIELLKKRGHSLFGIVFVGNKNNSVEKTIVKFGKRIEKELKIIGRIPIIKKINRKSIKKFSNLVKI